MRSQALPNYSKPLCGNNVVSCTRCVLMLTSLSCRFVPLTMCTNDDFSTSHQAPSACFAQHVTHDVTAVNRGCVLALVSSTACLLANISAACMLVTSAWPHSLTLCSNSLFEERIYISCMHWHVMVLVVLLAVAPLAASKSTLSRLCRGVVSVSPSTGTQASNTTKQLLSAHCATQSRSWHSGVFATL